MSVPSGYKPTLILGASSVFLCLDGSEPSTKEAERLGSPSNGDGLHGRIGCGLYHAASRSETTRASFFHDILRQQTIK